METRNKKQHPLVGVTCWFNHTFENHIAPFKKLTRPSWKKWETVLPLLSIVVDLSLFQRLRSGLVASVALFLNMYTVLRGTNLSNLAQALSAAFFFSCPLAGSSPAGRSSSALAMNISAIWRRCGDGRPLAVTGLKSDVGRRDVRGGMASVRSGIWCASASLAFTGPQPVKGYTS